jgi:DNA-binding response OmpR family regulator/predicted Ser/Thr protein kinase
MDRMRDPTQLMPLTRLRQHALFRHRVEAASRRIASDCEWVFQQLHGARRHRWGNAMGEAMLAAHRLAAIAGDATPRESEAPEGADLALREMLQVELTAIVQAMSGILGTTAATADEELWIGDANTIRESAATLLASMGADVADTASAAGSPLAREQERTARILVVDDDRELRHMLHKMVSRLGYEVLVSENGFEALETMRGIPVDLVITDMNMPVMDGLQLIAAVKSSPDLRDIPIVVVSSEDDTARVIRSIEQGAEDHLGKPFDATLLGARIRACLARKTLRDLELEYLRRVGSLVAAAEAVDRDAYVPGSLAAISSGSDELANLARVFERVVLNLKSREDRLHHRLRKLRGEVDQLPSSGSTAAIASAESPFGSGQLVADRYLILGELGRGGMGMVYHATDQQLHEDVAIKVVRNDLVKADPTLTDRLKEEIRIARKLTHPNILRAHDFGESNGTHFFTMEYVRGRTLADLLDHRGRLGVDAVLALGTQLAEALAAAHAQGVVHRDIKPSNLLMRDDGRLAVMDFGLAKVTAHGHGTTLSGFVVGTPQYMAPEQLMGGELDGRADLFAAGVVLYESLAGRTPFDADSPITLLAQMVDGAYPPLFSLVPDIPQRLEALIMRLLQLQPEQRLSSAGEMANMLSEIETSLAVETPA